MRSKETILFTAMVFLYSTAYVQTPWNDSESAHEFIGNASVRIALKLNSEPATETLPVCGLGGIAGDLHYDAEVFGNPRIEPAYNNQSVQAAGLVIEPGVYRFTIFSSPMLNLYAAGIDLAWFTFKIEDVEAFGESPKTFSFHDCQAAKYRDSQGLLTRESYGEIPLAPIVVQNKASDWLLYE